MSDVENFKQSCEILSAKFAKIDKRSHSISNLAYAVSMHKFIAGGVWLPCCRLGAPCSSRIMATIESNDSHRGKYLLVACAEVKDCILSTGKKT
jgi:hypothetical protein